MMRFLSCLLLLLFATGAHAHTIGRSSSDWTVADGVTRGQWVMASGEWKSLSGGHGADASALVTSFLHLEADGQACPLTLPVPPHDQDGEVVLMVSAPCAADRISFEGLFRVAPTHVHLLRVTRGTGRTEYLLTRAQPDVSLGAEATGGFGPYLHLGIFHILEGFDHLAFLLALMLAVRSLRPLVWCITGFTLGHSITLALGALGHVAPNSAVVEPLIAFTIAFTVADWAVARSARPKRLMTLGLLAIVGLALADHLSAGILPPVVWAGLLLMSTGIWGISLEGEEKAVRILPLVTIGFGLIHGFGFVGVLTDIGLPVESRVLALFGFNLGVEVGQLLFLGAALGVLTLMKRFASRLLPVAEPVFAMAILAVGLFWFSERVFFT